MTLGTPAVPHGRDSVAYFLVICILPRECPFSPLGSVDGCPRDCVLDFVPAGSCRGTRVPLRVGVGLADSTRDLLWPEI